MPDAFFQKKRKRTTSASAPSRAGPSRTKPAPSSSSSRMRKGPRGNDDNSDDDDDDVPGGGIDEMDLTHTYNDAPNSDDEADAAETPAEARVRLAKMYLQGLSSSTPAGEGDDFFESDETPSFGLADAAQADRDNIAARLQKDVAAQSGKIHLYVANRIAPPLAFPATSSSSASPSSSPAPTGTAAQEAEKEEEGVDYTRSLLAVRGHRLSVTCAVASADARWLFTASKDGSIIRYRLRDGKMMRILPRRSTHLDPTGAALPPSPHNKSKTSGAARRRARLTSSSSTSMYVPVGLDEGHDNEIYTLSVSSDGQYIASGGHDKRVCIWSATPSSERFIKALGGHKDAITSLCFRGGSNELYTASLDRTLKLYDVAQLSYVETLFGHQEAVLSLSCLAAETAVSAGGRDRTCRYWKIRDESQLVFRAGIRSRLREVLEGGDLSKPEEEGKMSRPTEAVEGSVEVVAMVDSHHFVSGGDSGTVSLWNLGRKKPVYSLPVAHGFDVTHSETEGEIRTPRWITAVAALPYSDLFVTGSWDGSIRLWALNVAGGQVKGFRALFALPAHGVVNSLQIVTPPLNSTVANSEGLVSSTAIQPQLYKRTATGPTHRASAEGEEEERGSKLDRVNATPDNAPPVIVAALGQEHRLGRWIKQPTAKNVALVIPLRLRLSNNTTRSNGTDKFKLV